MSFEVELKYNIPNRKIADNLLESPLITKHLVGEYMLIEMKSQYFDTNTGELSRLKCALRLRDENGKRVATFKTPGSYKDGLFMRGEWEVTADSIKQALPELLKLDIQDLYKKVLRNNPFYRTCSLNFTRKQAIISPTPGFKVQFSVDDGFMNDTQPFIETEIELIEGSKAQLIAYGNEICKKFNLFPEPSSKLVRALTF